MVRSQSTSTFSAAILLFYFITVLSPAQAFIAFLKTKSGEPDITLSEGDGDFNASITVIPKVKACTGVTVLASLFPDVSGARFDACSPNNTNICEITNTARVSTMQLLFKTSADAATLADIHGLTVDLEVIVYPPGGYTPLTTIPLKGDANMGDIEYLAANEKYLITAKYQLGTASFPGKVHGHVTLTVTGNSQTILCYTTDVIIKPS